MIDREKLKASVPRFRGLVWVASDEDEVEEYERAMRARRRHASQHGQQHQHHHNHVHTLPSASGHVQCSCQHPSLADDDDDDDDDLLDDEEDDYSTSSVDEDEDEEELVEDEDGSPEFGGMPMDIDGELELGVVGMDVDSGMNLMDHDEGAHMHPVVHHRPTLSAIDTSAKGEHSCNCILAFFLSSYSFFALPFSHLCFSRSALWCRRAHEQRIHSCSCLILCTDDPCLGVWPTAS